MLIFFCVAGQLVFGQQSEEPENAEKGIDMDKLKSFQLSKMGKIAMKQGDYYTAIDYLEKYYELYPDNIRMAKKLADCYRHARDYNKAGELYSKLFQETALQEPLYLYYYAQMQKANGDYEGAMESFNEFKKLARDDKALKEQRKLAVYEEKGCELAKILMDSIPLNVEIVHLDTSINKAHVEFSPMPINDTTLLYASLKMDSSVIFDIEDTLPVRKFYVAKLRDSAWVHGGVLQGPFNDDFVSTGNGSFSPDGNRFYFTRCETKPKNKVICAIYVSKKEDGQWQEPVKLNTKVNDPKYSSTQPTVGIYSRMDRDDLEMLYFVSDREEGSKGGLDIWYSIYNPKEDEFLEPRNAAGKVNSPGDEITPFYDTDTRTLYYSSNGKIGIGGFDIFKTTGQTSRWSNPVNIGFPINSSADDLYFVLKKNKNEGFFVSNREGGVALKNSTCCDDIYSFEYLQYIHVGIGGKLLETEEVNDSLVRDIPLPGAKVNLHVIEDEGKEFMLTGSTKTNEQGEYFLKLEHGKTYKLEIKKEGYFSKWYDVTTGHITASDTMNKVLKTSKIPKKAIVVKNIYYDYDKANLSDEAKGAIDSTLLKLLLENPEIVIEISSHTDSKGDDHYNMRLSQQRAESVVRYLIDKNIDKKRLVAKGYGESQPIAPNENPDGTDNPEGRQKNRRTEFKVIGKMDFEIEYEE